MISIASQPMGPAVEETAGGVRFRGFLGLFGSLVGDLEACLAGCDVAKAFLVGCLEVFGHICPCAIGCGLFAPIFDCVDHDSALFECLEAKANTRCIRDLVLSCLGELATLVGTSENAFGGCLWVPV